MSFGPPTAAASLGGRVVRAFCLPAAITLAMVALATSIEALLPYGYAVVAIEEDGPIEAATLAVYAATLGDCIYLTLSRHAPAAWRAAVLVTFPLLREMDFNRAFTQISVTSFRYWRSDLPTPEEKALVALIVGVMLALAFLAVRASWTPFWRRLRALERDAVTLAAAPALLVTGALIDKFHYIDLIVMERDVIFRALEESLEFGAAICMLAALVQWRRATHAPHRRS